MQTFAAERSIKPPPCASIPEGHVNKTDRIHFEETLQQVLKKIECEHLAITAVKRGLKLRFEKKLVAELDFQYLTKAHAFTLHGRVVGGPLHEAMSKIEAPYRSNLFCDAVLSFTTSGRQDKKPGFDIYGKVDVPRPEHASETCEAIRHALETHYIPWLVGCVLPSERTLSDVIASPTDYAYPAVFIHCATTCNPSLLNDALRQRLKFCKKIIKNKAFDFPLLGIS